MNSTDPKPNRIPPDNFRKLYLTAPPPTHHPVKLACRSKTYLFFCLPVYSSLLNAPSLLPYPFTLHFRFGQRCAIPITYPVTPPYPQVTQVSHTESTVQQRSPGGMCGIGLAGCLFRDDGDRAEKYGLRNSQSRQQMVWICIT